MRRQIQTAIGQGLQTGRYSERTRIAKEVGSRAKAFKLVKHDKKLVRFYLPLEPKNPDDLCRTPKADSYICEQAWQTFV